MKRRMLRIAALMLAMSMVLGACGNQDAPATGTELLENTEQVGSEKEEEGNSELPTETEEQAEGTEKPEGIEELESAEDAKNPEETKTEESEPAEVVTESETDAEQAPAYTVTALEAKTMYVKQSVNVRKGPSSDYEKVGSLKTNDEVTVIGQANETGWYQIQYEGVEGFVSNKYVTENKVEEQASTVPSSNPTEGTATTPETPASNQAESTGHISWTGAGTTLPNLGVSIPTLGAFNSPALGDSANTFIGDDSSTEGHDAMQRLYDTANAIHDACVNQGIMPWDSAGFLVGDNAISWSFTTFSTMNSLELWRDPANDIYTLEVNIRLEPGHNVLNGTDLSLYSNDILLYLCSVISSQPNTLYAQIYEDIEGEICISDSSWTTVGDCKVQYDDEHSYNNHYVYLIKGN